MLIYKKNNEDVKWRVSLSTFWVCVCAFVAGVIITLVTITGVPQGPSYHWHLYLFICSKCYSGHETDWMRYVIVLDALWIWQYCMGYGQLFMFCFTHSGIILELLTQQRCTCVCSCDWFLNILIKLCTEWMTFQMLVLIPRDPNLTIIVPVDVLAPPLACYPCWGLSYSMLVKRTPCIFLMDNVFFGVRYIGESYSMVSSRLRGHIHRTQCYSSLVY